MADRLLLTVMADSLAPVDVAVDYDDHATVADFANQLTVELDLAGRLTKGVDAVVAIDGRSARPLDRDDRLNEADIVSGDVIRLGFELSDKPLTEKEQPAFLTFAVSPHSTRELHWGINVVGRGADADVPIDDPSASRFHASINIGDVVVVADLGSTNGTRVNGEILTGPRVIGAEDAVTLGSVGFRITMRGSGVAHRAGGPVRFNRPPRVFPPYRGPEFEVPQPPGPEPRQRFPKATAIAPMFMALAMYMFTKNLMSIAFIALSPMMLIASYWETKRGNRADHAEAVRLWRSKVVDLRERIAAEAEREVSRRLDESPSVDELIEIGEHRDERLWERGPDHEDFLRLRVGIADLPSRISVKVEKGGSDALRTEVDGIPEEFAIAQQVPLEVDLRAGGVGIAGPYETAVGLARAMVAQAVVLHSPVDLRLMIIVGDSVATDWAWLRWAPHCQSQTAQLPVADSRATAVGLIAQLKAMADGAPDRASGATAAKWRLVVIDDTVAVDRSELIPVLEKAKQAGVTFIWVSRTHASLPRPCGAVVMVDPAESLASVAIPDSGDTHLGVAFEVLGEDRAVRLTRRLAPVQDVAYTKTDSGLPAAVALPELLGGADLLGDPAFVLERWAESINAPRAENPSRALQAPVGMMAEAPYVIDIRRDGPHALVAGTTGSGKSEFLQAWVLGMAASHPPERVTFLFVDYKGGAAFKDCNDLPHRVGLVTDLDSHQVRRVLVSLEAEVHRRERLLNVAGAKDLISMEEMGHPETPPNLMIVVDEFAALASDVPEFVDGVVDIAQRGRSLGLHLVLATQRPQGVIKDNIRANTNLRVALRVADEAESLDVVGIKDAAFFDTSTPGRAIARIGATRFATFQSGYAGAKSGDLDAKARVQIGKLGFTSIDFPASQRARSDTPPDIELLVAQIRQAHARTGKAAPRRPWQDPLPNLVTLPERTTGSDNLIYVGWRDLPDEQRRDWTTLEPEREGSYLVVGTSGSGKTNLLRTVAASLAASGSAADVEIYGIDFSGRGLEMLTPLPIVGSIIQGSDHERVLRLLRRLQTQVEQRSTRFAELRVGNLSEYRKLGHSDEKRIFVLLDGVGVFAQAFESIEGGWAIDALTRLVADGRQTGIHFVLTHDRHVGLPLGIGSNIQRVITLRMASPDDYRNAGIDPDVMGSAAPPGRGFDQGAETQFAVFGSAEVSVQAEAIEALAKGLSDLERAVEIGRLPDQVGAGPAMPDQWYLGVDDFELAPVGIPIDTRWFTVFGPAGSGKTTSLLTIAGSVFANWKGKMVAVSPYGSINESSLFSAVVTDADQMSELFESLAGSSDSKRHPVAVFIDDLSAVLESDAQFPLAEYAKLLRNRPGLLVTACDNAWARRAFIDPLPELRADKNGLLLQPDFAYDGDLLGTSLGRSATRAMPPGRGYLVRRGKALLVQVATVHE